MADVMEAEEGMDATEILMRDEKEEGEGEEGRGRSASEPMKKKDEVSYIVTFKY